MRNCLYILLASFVFCFTLQVSAATSLPQSLVAEPELEKVEATSLKVAYEEFIRKGGTLLTMDNGNKITLLPGDVVYPACSAGWCRSQTLRYLLKPYEDKITLMAPHATRYGFDPYNGKPNWHRTAGKDEAGIHDEFPQWAGVEKVTRFGYDQFIHLKDDKTPTPEQLAEITGFYNKYYYGANHTDKRRVFITFALNTHAMLVRLAHANERLENVVLVHYPLDDLASKPPPEWNTYPNSVLSYERLAEIIAASLDLSELE